MNWCKCGQMLLEGERYCPACGRDKYGKKGEEF